MLPIIQGGLEKMEDKEINVGKSQVPVPCFLIEAMEYLYRSILHHKPVPLSY
jgi:hypothetical protein